MRCTCFFVLQLRLPDAQPCGGGDLAQDTGIHPDVAHHIYGLCSVRPGKHRGGQVFDGQHRSVVRQLAAQFAIVGDVADGQAGQMACHSHAGKTQDGQLQGIGAIGLAGKGGLPVSIHAVIFQCSFVGMLPPELDTYGQILRSVRTKCQPACQHQGEQHGGHAPKTGRYSEFFH